ncbi:hypothetical protein niasHT_005849 [Heterodera trifolii]|uniref:DDE-1 domain-containing protein n=1 Tax=Heterodera trifolii TaxID=157864 RepID=A0ABD2MCI6_9BILA
MGSCPSTDPPLHQPPAQWAFAHLQTPHPICPQHHGQSPAPWAVSHQQTPRPVNPQPHGHLPIIRPPVPVWRQHHSSSPICNPDPLSSAVTFAATATILVLVRTNAGSAQNLAMRLHHAHLHMTPKRDLAQKSHAVCAGSTMTLTKAQVPPFQQNQSATKTTKKNTCFVMIFGNFHFGARLLVWDSFRCHISKDTKKTLRRLALHSAVIPGGTTKYIQVNPKILFMR